MAEPLRDRWAGCLLQRRHGGDPEDLKATMEFLTPVRDRVLKDTALTGGETLLDVGAGDGLIAFGALELVGEEGRVIFSDISQDLLDHSRSLAREMGVLGRCEFVRASADDLSELEDASVDAVTTRSVLIYVKDKRRAFEEFHRVLNPGGRLSIFEPINRFNSPNHPSDGSIFMGCDAALIQDLARKVWAIYERCQPPDEDPMLDFDERDLFDLAEEAGFEEIYLHNEARRAPNVAAVSAGWGRAHKWEILLKSSSNPRAPTLEEAMAEALTQEEAGRFTAHLRPLVEKNENTARHAAAYLRALR